jgi:hypothetical protein
MHRDRHFDADRLRARGLPVLSAANRPWTAQVLCGNGPHGVFLQRPVSKEEDSAGPSPTLGGTIYLSLTMFWNLGYSTGVLTWKRKRLESGCGSLLLKANRTSRTSPEYMISSRHF